MNSFVNLITGLFELALFLAVILAVVAFWGYNKIRRLSENVKEAWSNITVVTRKKVALINQLIDVVKAYQESEKFVMVKVSDDLTVASLQQAQQQSGVVLSTISGMAQRFPELRASEQYHRLVDSIQQSEATLESARKLYNVAVKEYNVVRTSMPHVFYSRLLGFNAAMYLDLEAVESPEAATQKPIISDDGERVNELLGRAGSRMLGAAKRLAEQGRLLAEKSATHGQGAAEVEFHYLDVHGNPKGPVTRTELDRLYQSGEVKAETDLLPTGSKGWKKYADLTEQQTPPKIVSQCGSCGAPLSSGDTFCSECGTRVSTNA